MHDATLFNATTSYTYSVHRTQWSLLHEEGFEFLSEHDMDCRRRVVINPYIPTDDSNVFFAKPYNEGSSKVRVNVPCEENTKTLATENTALNSWSCTASESFQVRYFS